MKVKQNLSQTSDFLFVGGRFYYGNAPMGSYPCKDCTVRHEGCHGRTETPESLVQQRTREENPQS